MGLATERATDRSGGARVGLRLVCPETKLPLRPCGLEEAERLIADGAPLATREGGPQPVGRTPVVLVREDDRCAYPVLGDVPVLLRPERLMPPRAAPFAVDLVSAPYAEAYEEMDFYSSEAERAESALERDSGLQRLLRLAALTDGERRRFPAPAELWLDATYETTAQWQAFRHLAPLEGRRVLQLGGKGGHAVTLLLAGASEAWVVSPMVAELEFATALAHRLGVGERLRVAAGVAEELPLADGCIDAVYTISLHHMVTALALPECRRVLRTGGAFAAVEPWRAPLYRIGTRVLGKREPEVHCRPLERARLEPLFECFPTARLSLHGTLLRYPALALSKAGVRLGTAAMWRVARLDDALSSVVPGLRRWGSCAAVLGTA